MLSREDPDLVVDQIVSVFRSVVQFLSRECPRLEGLGCWLFRPALRVDPCPIRWLTDQRRTELKNIPPHWAGFVRGAVGIRTPDFCLAKAALYQLSYGPSVGLFYGAASRNAAGPPS